MPDPREPSRKSPGSGESPSPPSPSPSPGAEEGSGRGSERGSQAEDGFLADAGPSFDPAGEAPPEPPEHEPLEALEPEWGEDSLRTLLLAKGELLHTFAGVAENDWRYTAADLKAIAPPLARILNRYPVTRAAAGAQDPLALAIGVAGYTIRSGKERLEVIRELEAEVEEEPITGVPAPPGSGPPEAEPEPEVTGSGPPQHVQDVDPDAEPGAVEWRTG